jgi:hypothetical protein
MSEEAPEPLDPELAQLFAAEARFAAEPAARRARVWQGVAGAVLAAPIIAGTAAGASHTATGAAKGLLTGKLVGITMAAFLAGGVSGAAVYRATVKPPEPVIVRVSVPTPAPIVTHLPVPAPIVDAGAPAAAPASTRRASESESDHASALARERAIIDVARAAIAADHTDSALAAIERHAREFPRGSLSEEREGLRILALSRAGRSHEAAELAARFRLAHPHSLLLPAIDSALGNQP